ncbi:MAG: hypothetical protein IJ574_05845 [Bacilli bacterium]|nr:hypothetical protein [Bacilli bacterium]
MKDKIIKTIRSNKILFNIAKKANNIIDKPSKNVYKDNYTYFVYKLNNIDDIDSIIKKYNEKKHNNSRLVIMVDENNYNSIYNIVNNYDVSIITLKEFNLLNNSNYKLVEPKIVD